MKLTILQQNDTHGALTAHPEYFWTFSGPEYRRTGGLARAAAYAKTVRQQEEHVLYIDGGDTFHGTAPLVLSKGEVMPGLLNAMGLDAMVPGNWDSAYGIKRMKELMGMLDFPALAANLYESGTGEHLLTPYIIKEMNGCTCALIGLAYPYEESVMPPSFSEGADFTLGTEELPGLIQHLRTSEKADLIIVISHMGLPLDVKLASLVDGIDILLSGHSHDRIEQPIRQNGTVIIQSGASGSFLGRIDLEWDGKEITGLSHKLITLTEEDYAADPEVDEMIRKIMEPYVQQLSDPVGRLLSPIHRMTLNEAPMDRLITDAYVRVTGADAAFSHGWRYGVPVLPGEVTGMDLYNIIPTNPELVMLELEGRDLLKALEANLEQVFAPDPFDQKGGYVLRSSGVTMAFKPYNPKGSRIQHIEISGEPLQLSRGYKIAVGGEQILRNFQSDRQMLGITAHEAIQEHFSAHPDGIRIDETPRIHSI